ncbi:MAG TPA: hypothetical protein DIU00_14080 [Phycisphaerales bacterium]|nr:hypothetical protein [Phycisphaerales bacterium]
MSVTRIVYMALLLMVAVFGCQPNESDSESIRIKPSKVRGEALGRSLLHLAPNWKVAERLIKEGVDVNAKNSYGMTPLHSAAYAGSADLVELLIANSADVNTKDDEGRIPIDFAKDWDHTEIVELLKEHGSKE